MTGRNDRAARDPRRAVRDRRVRLSPRRAIASRSTRPASRIVRAAGRGHLSKAPVLVPIRFTAARVTGVGDVAGGILRNLSIDGVLRVTPQAAHRRRSAAELGQAQRADQPAARPARPAHYDVGINGALGRYLIPGLGIVDVQTTLKVVPGAGGTGTRVVGTGQRADGAARQRLLPLASRGGLPRIVTGLERTPDGVLHLSNLRAHRAAAPHHRQRHAAARRHLPFRGQRAAGDLWPADAQARRQDRPADARPRLRTAQ